MTDAIAQRGPDGVGHWIDGPVGLGQRMFHTTPESLRERQPLTNEDETLCLTLDGRVDNRDELRAALLGKGFRLRDATDAELVLRAYECWGVESPRYVLGDFAYAIWDARQRQLFCARDIFGIRPLVYYHDARRFLFGSELRQLLSDPAVPRRPNEGMIAEHLTGFVANLEETLYEGIRRLPPAHYLLVGPAGLRQGRYWDIDPQRKIRYRTDAEYAGHFLTIFKEAVRCRLRSHGRVGAHLSGGMDSSSIVAVVKLLQEENVAPDCGFESFSMVYPQGWPCDERAYIHAVIERCQVPANLIESALPGLAHYVDEAGTYQDFPDYPNGGGELRPLNRRAREKGFRVLLTGNGGNEWLEDGPDHLADLLRGLKLRELVRQARVDAQMLSRRPSVLGLILQQGVRPLLPGPVRRLGRKLMGRKDRVPDWLNENYAAQCGLLERLDTSRRKRRFPRLAQERMYNILNDGGADFSYALINRQAASEGVEERHPFNDRRLLEYALAVPETQRWGPTGVKHVLRVAMRPYLPEPVIRRQIQADFSVLFVKSLEALEAENFFGQLAIGAQGWVKPAAAIQAYQRMKQLFARNERGYGTLMWGLWNICAIELWFRQMFLARQTHAPGYRVGTGQS